MAGITLNSNIASLSAQRRLGRSTDALRESFTRISSGLRINHARDDASGLAISENLKTDARVLNQGVRNVNDAVSLLNTAEGATNELSSILTRTRELATQAANGTLSKDQRSSLNEEANALVAEYNRIVQSTQFGGVPLLDRSLTNLRVQSGYGTDASLTVSLGSSLARVVGDGTFDAPTSVAQFPGQNLKEIEIGDFNYDGVLDFAGSIPGFYAGTPALYVQLGNGDGSFKSATTYSAASQLRYIQVTDVNGDSIDDIVGGAPNGQVVSVYIGNGDGSFRQRTDYAVPGVDDIAIGDINGDGVLDVATFDIYGSSVYVLTGNSNGSFNAAVSRGGLTNMMSLDVGDMNLDGSLDLVFTTNGGLGVMLGNGDDTFLAPVSVASVAGSRDIKLADMNGDGRLDAVVGSLNAAGLGVHYADASGMFGALQTITGTRKAVELEIGDIDGDGQKDILSSAYDDNVFQVTLGNGNGTFKLPTTFAGIQSSEGFELGDVNGDGGLDIVAAQYGASYGEVFLANTHRGASTIENLALDTRAGALQSMRIIDTALQRVDAELGSMGAAQSRLETTVTMLQTTRENYLSAAGQITDLDMAEEAANLVRAQILQQSGAAVLAQANQSPALALVLLGRG